MSKNYVLKDERKSFKNGHKKTFWNNSKFNYMEPCSQRYKLDLLIISP